MVICIESPLNRLSVLSNLHSDYERRFGATPQWLADLSGGRMHALLRCALERGAPLIAADAPY
jgi:hypothetical protein